MSYHDEPIEWPDVERFDKWLDDNVGEQYTYDGWLAQDWARVAKITEEAGEAIAELILSTGQNPRKPLDTKAHDRLLAELGDVAFTAIYAIQHFTKDMYLTKQVLRRTQTKHMGRM